MSYNISNIRPPLDLFRHLRGDRSLLMSTLDLDMTPVAILDIEPSISVMAALKSETDADLTVGGGADFEVWSFRDHFMD